MQEQRINKYNKYFVAEDFLLVSNYNSVMEFPFFLRAVINTSSKGFLTEKRQSINALVACFLLSGQRAIPTRARKSIAGFKLRENALIGCRTTLRKRELYTIIDKLLIFVLPRLYSEKKNDTILKMANLLTLKRSPNVSNFSKTGQNQVSERNKGFFFFEERGFKLDKGHSQHADIISQQERSQLSILLMFLRKSNNNIITKNEKISYKGQIYHYTLGIKDLLLIPELQEFLPLFESVRGINIGVSFSNPKIKGTFLKATSLSSKQHCGLQNLMPQALEDKVLRGPTHLHNLSEETNDVRGNERLLNLERIAHFNCTYNTIQQKERKERKEIITLSFKTNNLLKKNDFPSNPKTVKVSFQNSTYKKKEEKTYDLLNQEHLKSVNINNSQQESKDIVKKKRDNYRRKAKSGIDQEQGIKRKQVLNTFYLSRDTPHSKENRKMFFLTCFQYPE